MPVFLLLICSRLVVMIGIIFSATYLSPSPLAVGEGKIPWYQYLLRWDGGWYLKIVREGYSYNGDDLIQQSINFQPLYPWICKAVAVLFGIPPGAALVIVSNTLLLIALPLLFKLIKEDYGTELALYAMAAVCFFPASLFFSAGYTESLALLLIAICFLLIKKQRFVFASIFIGLALGTRLMSLVLLPPLLWELWRAYAKDIKRLAIVGVICLVIATSGIWLYMIYLWAFFNRPLAIVTSKRAWHGSSGGHELFRVLTLQPFQHLLDLWRVGMLPETLAPWIFVLFVILLAWFRKVLPVRYLLYAAGAWLMPYLLASGNIGFGSFTRYLLLAFPIFIILGTIFKRRFWLGLATLGLFAALLFLHTALYAQAYWAG
jgi:Gpi18-like mannosyltransferase